MQRPVEHHDFDSQRAFDKALANAIAESGRGRPGAPAMHLARFETPLGSLLAGVTEAKLAVLEFTGPDRLSEQVRRFGNRLKMTVTAGTAAPIEQLEHELDGYFSGSLRCFTVALAPAGTEFQRAAWRVLQGIPHGQTLSYGDQARQIGRPRAVRAVAQANGANPITIVVPCHRVIGSDGTLTGYGGGLWRKRWLLAHESAVPTVSI